MEEKKNEFLEEEVNENQEINEASAPDLNEETTVEEEKAESSEEVSAEEHVEGEDESSSEESEGALEPAEETAEPEVAEEEKPVEAEAVEEASEPVVEVEAEATVAEVNAGEKEEESHNTENSKTEKADKTATIVSTSEQSSDKKSVFGKMNKKDKKASKAEKKKSKSKLPFILIAIVLLIIIWPKHNHTWGEWQVVQNATCTEAGSSTRSCSDCGEVETKTLEALGHSFGDWSIISDATCTENGSKTRVCSTCGHDESAEIAAFGHDMADATCTSPKTCKNNCGHTEGEKLGHKEKNGYCDRCGEKLTIDINTVYIDHDECSIKVTTIDPYSIWGYRIYVQLENKSVDKNYTFYIEDIAVNGVMCSTLFSTTVAPGKLANDDITISTSVLKENGIVDFTDIEISFKVYESGQYGTDGIVRETIHIYPYGEDKATKFVRESQPGDIVLVDNQYVTVTAIKFGYTSSGGYEVDLYIVNKTSDTELSVSLDDVSINGVMIDPFYSTSVLAGKSEFSTVSWSSTALNNNCVEDVTDIEANLTVDDANDWFADDIVDKIINIYPKGESAAIKYVRESQDTDIVLVDNEYVTVTVIKMGLDSYGSYKIDLCIVNKTSDIRLSVGTEDETINDFMMDPFYATSVAPGKVKFSTISWSSTALSNNGITEVEEIEFVLTVDDYDDWSATDFVDIVVTLPKKVESTTSTLTKDQYITEIDALFQNILNQNTLWFNDNDLIYARYFDGNEFFVYTYEGKDEDGWYKTYAGKVANDYLMFVEHVELSSQSKEYSVTTKSTIDQIIAYMNEVLYEDIFDSASFQYDSDDGFKCTKTISDTTIYEIEAKSGITTYNVSVIVTDGLITEIQTEAVTVYNNNSYTNQSKINFYYDKIITLPDVSDYS